MTDKPFRTPTPLGTLNTAVSSQFLVPSGGAVVLALSVMFFLTLGAGALRRMVAQ